MKRLFVSAAMCYCAAASAQPVTSDATPPEYVAVLLAGLQGYENSIESLYWKQRWYWPPNLSKPKGPRSTWTVGQASSRYRDSEWRWCLDSTFTTRDEPDSQPVAERTLYIGDGGTRLATGEENKWRGVLSTQDTFFIGGATLETLLGRGVDYSYPERGRVLSEMLRLGERVEFLPPTQEEPWPGVRAINAVGQGYSNLDARVDPDLGFMPRLVRVWRSSDHATAEAAVTVDTFVLDGVHLPSVAVRIALNQQVVPVAEHLVADGVARDFELSRKLDGLPPFPARVRHDVQAWVARGQEVRWIDMDTRIAEGPSVWTSQEWGLIAPVVLVIDQVRLNPPRESCWTLADLPASTTIFNAYTSRREAASDAINIQRRWGPRVVLSDGVPGP